MSVSYIHYWEHINVPLSYFFWILRSQDYKFLPSECELMWDCLSVSLYLVITFLVTVGTLHRLLSFSIVVHQELQQTVLWREGAIPFHYGWDPVAKTHIQRATVLVQ